MESGSSSGYNRSYEGRKSGELCKLWLRGECGYGERCKFVHASNDRMTVNHQRPTCNYFTAGARCPYVNCKYSHQTPQWADVNVDMRRETSAISIPRADYRDTVHRMPNQDMPRESSAISIPRADYRDTVHRIPNQDMPRENSAFSIPRADYRDTVHRIPNQDMPRENSAISVPRADYRDTVHRMPNQDMPRENSAIIIPRTDYRGAWKTKLCNEWTPSKRSCFFGDGCRYAHGYAELRGRASTSSTISNTNLASNSGRRPAPPNVPRMPASNVPRMPDPNVPPNVPRMPTPNVQRMPAPNVQRMPAPNVQRMPAPTVSRMRTPNVPRVPPERNVRPFDWNKKLFGIYADWINEVGPVSSSKQQ